MYFSTLLSTATLFHLSIAGYVLKDDYMKDFYNQFDFFTAPDPTNGFVKYIDQATAKSSGLINSTSSGSVSWGVDHTNKTPNGRPSIRLTSKKKYNSGLFVLDVEHMPVGCGTWPAYWMVGPSWPKNGEIDILEGVNEQEKNAMTLHTGPGCSISANGGGFSGKIDTPNCDVNAPNQNENAGCSIKHPSKNSYGTGLNSIKGGVYATLWTDKAISVYFFPRDSIPKDVLGNSPDPASWGTPAAKFSGACDIPSVFNDQQIVFDTTFCGDWAGQVWSSGSCASKAATCNAYVQNNPSAFANAYWTIKALRVYQSNGNGSPAPSAPASNPGGKPSTKAPVPSKSSTKVLVSSVVPPSVGLPSSIGVPSVSVSRPAPSQTTLATLTRPSGVRPTNRPSGPNKSRSPTKSLAPLPTVTNSFPLGSVPVPPSSAPAPIASVPVSSVPAVGPSSGAAAPSAPSNNGPMSGFRWPAKQQQSGTNTKVLPTSGASSPSKSTRAPVPIPSASKSSSAVVSVPSASHKTDGVGPTPSAFKDTGAAVPIPSSSRKSVVAASPSTSCTTETAAAVPSKVASDDIETIFKTVVVTVPYPGKTAAVAPPKRARHVMEHRRRQEVH
ncbi:glycoside hydrolase family 16 protein [Zopfia rhizophila CBS 207.26]|uniref:endo-1,3(4)-beta-glucanase n=1 Tax=Zopfia rhizophila CBS 207.26 TaxID=1314779 RepID=A0A6A6E6R6_9PEZI|nr:glycoside hydrolase family 16 protein [Zopfia rhizophila CBS 207.26]